MRQIAFQRTVAVLLLSGLVGLTGTVCGKSPAEIEAGFAAIEKGMLSEEVRQRMGEPETTGSSPRIPDLEHWKYAGGKLTVSIHQGRVLGKFNADASAPMELPED
jgi:hypothetical protein